MAAKEITTIEISIEGKKLIFDKNNDKSKVDFDTGVDDGNENNVRIELGIAKVFHKVLNFIKTDTELFQKQEFELMGEMLSKIIFGKQGDLRAQPMKDTYAFIRAGMVKYCRIILSFDGQSNLANLPWEYVLYKIKNTTETYYLAANNKSCFQIMRRFPANVQPCKHPDQEKLFVILLMNVEGNSNITPVINSMSTEVPDIINMYDTLQKKYPGKLEYKVLDSCSLEEVKEKVEETVTGWKNTYNYEPAYILQYTGHAMLDEQIGKLAIRPKKDEKINWVKDRIFASLFGQDMLDVRQPSMVLFLACDSAKIGDIDHNLRGVAYEFTRINIPAIVGMQNEINTTQSCAFYYVVYESLLQGNDIAEAVTKGRSHLGTDHKDFNEKDLQPIGEPYKNNYFGSPVLFITTDEPVRMIKPPDETEGNLNIQAGAGTTGSQLTQAHSDRAAKTADEVTDNAKREIAKAGDKEKRISRDGEFNK